MRIQSQLFKEFKPSANVVSDDDSFQMLTTLLENKYLYVLRSNIFLNILKEFGLVLLDSAGEWLISDFVVTGSYLLFNIF